MSDEPTINGPATKVLLGALGYGNVTKLADEIGMPRTTLSLILNGHRHAGLKLAMSLSDVTGLPAYAFLGPNDPKAAALALAKQYGATAADLEEVPA